MLLDESGDRFNIFKVLGIGHLEVRTHSPILAELLNRRGKHGLGSLFLKKFLSFLKIEDFDADTSFVRLEYGVGRVTDVSGGRIDILILDRKGGALLIENKIHAGDQTNQLLRYRNAYPKGHLVYLTLEGRSSSDEVDLGQIRVSYSEHILSWLRCCRNEASKAPKVRETIAQYISLIEELTNQDVPYFMQKEIIGTILNDEGSFRAFQSLLSLRQLVQLELWKKLSGYLDGVAPALGLKRLEEGVFDPSKREDGFSFVRQDKSWENLSIFIGFDAPGYWGLFFGYRCLVFEQPNSKSEQLLNAFREYYPRADGSPNYPAWVWWDEYSNWSDDGFEAVRSGKFMVELRERLKLLKALADKVCF